MATIFSEDFTATSGTLITALTPAIGDSWTSLIKVGTGDIAVSGNAASANSSGLATDEGQLLTADATYSTADYEVSCLYSTRDTADDTSILAVRIQDADNMYALRWSTELFTLYKRTTGTWSTIGADAGAVAAAAGLTITLQVVGSTIKTFVDTDEIHSVTDSDHSAAGKAGFGFGAIIVSTDDCSSQDIDTFLVETVDAGGGTPLRLRSLMGIGS